MIYCDPLKETLEKLLEVLKHPQTPAPEEPEEPPAEEPADTQRPLIGIPWDDRTKATLVELVERSEILTRISNTAKPTVKLVKESSLTIEDFADDEPAKTARMRNGKLGIFVVPERINSVLELAFVMAHEYGHVEQAHEHEFVSGEAAPYMPYEQYKVMRWCGEQKAFQRQLEATIELIEHKATPEADKKALRALRGWDTRVRALLNGNIQQARLEIKGRYNEELLTAEYEANAAPDPAETYKVAVEKFKASPEWAACLKNWP